MTLDESLVEIIHCGTAREFMTTLRVTDDLWLPPHARETQWLFRGQGDADYPLIPSAWRSDPETQRMKSTLLRRLGEPIKQAILQEKQGYVPGSRDFEEFEEQATQNPNLKEVLLQAIFEMEAVRFFTEFVDRLGFPVPQGRVAGGDSTTAFDWEYWIVYFIQKIKPGGWKGDPSSQIWRHKHEPFVALARHHGVPVSLLDWTRKPFIAAFFAAEDAAKKEYRPKQLAIWAIHTAVIGGRGQRLQQPRLARSELGYLHIQEGALTFDVSADYFFINHGRWPSILEAVEDTPHSFDHAPMRKITLPTSEAEEVLRLLWAEGISRPYLMPTFDNIANALKQASLSSELLENQNWGINRG